MYLYPIRQMFLDILKFNNTSYFVQPPEILDLIKPARPSSVYPTSDFDIIPWVYGFMNIHPRNTNYSLSI